MKSIKLFNYRAGYMVAAAAVLLATFLPAFASADQVTNRSIQLSSSSATATAVEYTVNFKAVKAAAAFVVDFCSDSPVIGETCTPPTGLDLSAAATTDGTIDALTTPGNNKILVTKAITAAQDVSVALTNIANPTVAGTMYARIVTYNTTLNAKAYSSTGAASDVNVQDNGGVAMSITPNVAVSGAVLESMTFCVASAEITASCANASTNPPVLKLGETVGTTKALSPSAVSTGDLFTQISTNASSGAIVYLKSGANGCGGLINSSQPAQCYILPALTGGVTAGQAKFGVLAAADPGGEVTPTGTFQVVPASGYNDTTYALNYLGTNATGVTSTFGDPFLDTNSLPATGKNMKLTFGVSVTGSTPAGNYSADLSMIATGKY